MINWSSRPILRDTGTTDDMVYQKYVSPESKTGEYVWVQHLLNQRMSRLYMAEVEIEC